MSTTFWLRIKLQTKLINFVKTSSIEFYFRTAVFMTCSLLATKMRWSILGETHDIMPYITQLNHTRNEIERSSCWLLLTGFQSISLQRCQRWLSWQNDNICLSMSRRRTGNSQLIFGKCVRVLPQTINSWYWLFCNCEITKSKSWLHKKRLILMD